MRKLDEAEALEVSELMQKIDDLLKGEDQEDCFAALMMLLAIDIAENADSQEHLAEGIKMCGEEIALAARALFEHKPLSDLDS